MELLTTRLVPPRLPVTLVERGHLLEKLDVLTQQRLLLISASAGSGKTTLLSAWASRCRASGQKIAWLALDELDNEPTRFWIAVITALQSCLPTIGEIALGMLRSSQPPHFSATLATLLNELANGREEIVLILDDYQVIDDQAVHEALFFLLERLPDQVHVVLASRVDPPFALSRLRARGQMGELHAADLRFQQEETHRFLNEAMRLSLLEQEMDVLEQRTEGWITGLHLAALALRQRPDRSAFIEAFTGNQRYLLDYVQEEILDHLEPPLSHFLLQVSVLARLNASLCRAVTGEAASQQMLERLERANLFLLPLDEERKWYRFHDLFREALLARLRSTQPELVPVLHQRAARWFEEQGELRAAIAHLLAAADFSTAAQLMERAAEEAWLHGELHMLYRWVIALPDAVVSTHARFALTAALYILNASTSTSEEQRSRAYAQTEQIVARVENALMQQAQPLTETEQRLLEQRMSLLRAYSAADEAIMRGNLAHLRLIYQQLQQWEYEDELIWQILPLSITFTFRAIVLHEGTSLLPLFQKAKQRASRSSNRFATLKIMHWLAHVFRLTGRLHLTYQETQAALHLLAQVKGHTFLTSYFAFHQAFVLYQWNRLEQARTTLQSMLKHAETWQQIDLLTWGYQLLVRVELADGNLPGAQQAIQAMVELQHRGFVVRPSVLTEVQLQWWRANGNLAAASTWAAQVAFSPENWDFSHTDEFLALVRVYLAQNRTVQAVETLERFRGCLDQSEDLSSAMPFLALYAVALHQAGRDAHARAVATRLFSLTQAEGILQVYLQEGEAMHNLLLHLQKQPQGHASDIALLPHNYIAQLLTAFEQQAAQPVASSTLNSQRQASLPSTFSPNSPAVPALIEPLTTREQEVLCLLAEGASNQEIADQLIITLTTVKKHVGNLLMKLSAENRTHAVARARELALL